MKRKIIKQGHNTLTITLPSDWARRFNLEAGKEIDVTEKENGLFISTERNNETRKAEFDITGMDIPTIWKYFMAVYREGYDEILVKFNPDITLDNPYKFYTKHKLDLKYGRKAEKKPVYESLQGFVNRFIGVEIVRHGKNFVLIKEMGELTSKEFDSSLRRIFLIVQQMAEETLEAIKSGNPQTLQHLHDVDVSLDKFNDYCIRVLNKTANKEQRKTSLLFSTLYILELLGDEFKSIANHLINDFSGSQFKNIGNLVEALKEEFNLYYDLYYKFSKEKIVEISEADKRIYFELLPKVFKESKSNFEREIFHHLKVIEKYINALYELRIEMEY